MAISKRIAGRHRLNLAALLFLIAATGVGLGVARAVWQAFVVMVKDRSDPVLLQWQWETGFTAFTCLVTCWAIALVMVGARQNRCRVLLRQPGYVACLAITLAVAFALVIHAPVWIWAGTGRSSRYLSWFSIRMMANQVVFDGGVGSAVVVAWGLQILSGRWRPEPSWNDRLGRVIGFYWIVASPVFLWATHSLV